MDMLERMQQRAPYQARYDEMPNHLQDKAKALCQAYNTTRPDELARRQEILQALFGTCSAMAMIEPSFHCDYGFNIHLHGLAVINYNCVILDTSPVHIGGNAFIGPGVCLTCAGHALCADQRAAGLETSAPITLEDDVWLGANVTVCGGVTIGKGSVIGAGSVVTRDIPAGVVAAGCPCRVLRPITEHDRLPVGSPDHG